MPEDVPEDVSQGMSKGVLKGVWGCVMYKDVCLPSSYPMASLLASLVGARHQARSNP